ncbi:MAG: hypothetical protein Kow0074_09690 [Candidatus Zixiibacteriota bacterium]
MARLLTLLFVGELRTSAGPALSRDWQSWDFGIGWDNGVSVRVRLYHGWAFGLHHQYHDPSRIIRPQLGFPDQWNEYGSIVSGDFPLFENLSVGPLAEFIPAQDNHYLFKSTHAEQWSAYTRPFDLWMAGSSRKHDWVFRWIAWSICRGIMDRRTSLAPSCSSGKLERTGTISG